MLPLFWTVWPILVDIPASRAVISQVDDCSVRISSELKGRVAEKGRVREVQCGGQEVASGVDGSAMANEHAFGVEEIDTAAG